MLLYNYIFMLELIRNKQVIQNFLVFLGRIYEFKTKFLIYSKNCLLRLMNPYSRDFHLTTSTCCFVYTWPCNPPFIIRKLPPIIPQMRSHTFCLPPCWHIINPTPLTLIILMRSCIIISYKQIPIHLRQPLKVS